MIKTEKEKMINGDYYDASEKSLLVDRRKAREIINILNDSNTSKEERNNLLKETFGSSGKRLNLEPFIHFDYGYNIHVGENFYANFNSTFLDGAPITFGDDCMLGPNVQLYTAMHPLDATERKAGIEFARPITIGNNVWIGGGAIIVPGVTLGNNVVVAAGAVVTKDFPDNVLIGGNPAKIIKEI